MKKLFIVLALVLLVMPVWAADTKISDDVNLATLASGDEFACVDDPGGTPLSRSCTIDVILAYIEANMSLTEAEITALLSDVTDLFTNNDGALDDDDLSDDLITALSGVTTVTDGNFCQGGAGSSMDCDVATIPEASIHADISRDSELSTHAALTTTHGISAFGATLVDDANAATARTTLDVDQAGTDNSTDVTLAGTPDYITIAGQVITRAQIDLTADVTGLLSEANIHADIHRDSETKDGDLVSFDDQNNDYVATDVDEAIEELVTANASGPNAADGKVNWEQLVNVPAGFADGTDDGAGGGSGDITDVGSCTTGDCDGHTITWGDGSSGQIVWTYDGDAGTDGTQTYSTVEDQFIFNVQIEATAFQSTVADPADTGIVRLGNGEGVCWEASPTSSDVCISADTSEVVQISNGTLDAADLSGTVPSASVSEASVTQHEAALTITESQISDLGSYIESVATADISDVSVTQTEFAELETIGTTTISANQWALLGGLAETLTNTEVNLLDGITTLSGSNTGDQDLADTVAEISDLTATASEINTPLDGALVTLTEFKELETIGTTVISAGNWTGVSNLSGTNTGDQNLADTVAEITDLDNDFATMSVPANATISTFGESLTDDASASAARTTLDVDQAGTDNSTNVTLAGSNTYLTLSGQEITRGDIPVSALADGTDGELITWSATGVPATVAVGTSGHVLTSNGAGVAPTFQASAGGNDRPAGHACKQYFLPDGIGTLFWSRDSAAWTTSEMSCLTDTGDVDAEWQECNSNGGSCTTMNDSGTALDCDATTAVDDSLTTNTSVDADDIVKIILSNRTGASTQVLVCLEGTYD